MDNDVGYLTTDSCRKNIVTRAMCRSTNKETAFLSFVEQECLRFSSCDVSMEPSEIMNHHSVIDNDNF